jgi:hypothetical protein
MSPEQETARVAAAGTFFLPLARWLLEGSSGMKSRTHMAEVSRPQGMPSAAHGPFVVLPTAPNENVSRECSLTHRRTQPVAGVTRVRRKRRQWPSAFLLVVSARATHDLIRRQIRSSCVQKASHPVNDLDKPNHVSTFSQGWGRLWMPEMQPGRPSSLLPNWSC